MFPPKRGRTRIAPDRWGRSCPSLHPYPYVLKPIYENDVQGRPAERLANPYQSFARSTYEPSSVDTTIRVPATIWGGTVVRTPFESIAGL